MQSTMDVDTAAASAPTPDSVPAGTVSTPASVPTAASTSSASLVAAGADTAAADNGNEGGDQDGSDHDNNDNDNSDHGNGNEDGSAPTLSKKQQRRLARSESFAASKLARRAAERERRKAKRHLSAQALATARAEAAGDTFVDTSREALAKLGWLEQIPPRNDDEEAELLARAPGTEGALPDLFFKFKHKNTDDRMRQLLARPNLLEVVIDCGYESVMTTKEITSLETQLAHAYGANCRALRPVLLTVTGLGADSATRAALVKARTSIDGWHWRAHEQQLEEVYPVGSEARARLVYLCAEAEQEVVWPGDEQSKGEGASVSAAAYVAAADAAVSSPSESASSLPARPIFVLGGLVDHNRLPGAGIARARSLGLPTARFPLEKFVSAQDRVRGVLTTVAAFELLVAKQGMGWGDAVEAAMPRRWVKPACGAATKSAPAPAAAAAATTAATAAAGDDGEKENAA